MHWTLESGWEQDQALPDAAQHGLVQGLHVFIMYIDRMLRYSGESATVAFASPGFCCLAPRRFSYRAANMILSVVKCLTLLC